MLTYDLRGVAASGPTREYSQLRMSDWMGEDANAVGAWTRAEYPELGNVALGHSLGGHALLHGDGTGDLHGLRAGFDHSRGGGWGPQAGTRCLSWSTSASVLPAILRARNSVGMPATTTMTVA